MITPHGYQSTAVDAVRFAVRPVELGGRGARKVVLVLPTGGGKTICLAMVFASARAKGKRCILLAHRRELIRQTFCKLVRYGLRADDIGIIMAGTESVRGGFLFPMDPGAMSDEKLFRLYGRRRPTAPIQVASIDTYRLLRLKPRFDIVGIDECHRSLSPGYMALLDEHPDAIFFGLTATPYRADKRGLGEFWDMLIVGATPAQLVEAGAIVEPRAWTVPAESLPDVSGLRLKADGDYDDAEVEKRADRVELVGDIVSHWQRRAENRRTVVFASGVAHSMHIAERFCAAGIPAEHLDGTTPGDERDAILNRLERGVTLVVCNCDVLTEGWDMPCVKCAVLARPTRSLGKYLQQAGRILRPWEGVEAILLDHAGVMMQEGFGSPIDDHPFTLESTKRPRSPSEGEKRPRKLRECVECHALVTSTKRACPECGHEPEERAPAPLSADRKEEKAGELVEFKPRPRPREEPLR